MKRKVFFSIFVLTLCSTAALASAIFPLTTKTSTECTPRIKAKSATDPNFCVIFPLSVGSCAGAPHPNVVQMKTYYDVLLSRGSLQAGCNFYAPAGSRKSCYDQWTCYWNGGNSPNETGNHPGKCNDTGVACATMP